MTFWVWLKQQRKRDDPVGDLARDAVQDKGIRKWRTVERMSDYLSGKPDFVFDAFCDAVTEYINRYRE